MVTIDGKSYTVDVGLNKLDNLDTISAGVTLTLVTSTKMKTPVRFI